MVDSFKRKSQLPFIYKFLPCSIFVLLVFFFVMRLCFFVYFKVEGDSIQVATLLRSFFIGFRFDLRLAIILNLPLVFLFLMKKYLLVLNDKINNLCLKYLTVSFALVLLFYFSDFLYYAYLGTSRVDATVLRFLYNLKDSVKMVWQSYPIIKIILSYMAVVSAYSFLMKRVMLCFLKSEISTFKNGRKIFINIIFFLLIVFGLYGKLSQYPLRWSDAFFSTNNFVSVLTMNPILYFCDTLKNREVKYDKTEVEKYFPRISSYLKLPDNKLFDYKRSVITNKDNLKKKPNVVVVILESFAFYKTGLSENPLMPTPNFDEIAGKGILFDRFYAPHGGTARSVFTFLTGIPDVESIRTTSRNPLAVDQHMIINAFHDYNKFYFIGGSASWGNIRGLLSNNIKDLKIYEQEDYSAPRIDVWGISDLDLFVEANNILKTKKDKPFFAIIQTAGNHKPYTIPKNNMGFKVKDIPEDKAIKYGFRSVAAYNAYRFMDHSLGVFIDEVKKSNYFDNTIFVFFGDHGLLRNAEHIAKGENMLGLTDYHIPFLLYNPNLIKTPKVYHKVASEVDVMPTLASFLGVDYVNSTFGRDLLDQNFDDQRYAFTIIHRKVHEIGLIGKEYYMTLNSDGSNKHLYKIYSENPRDNLIDKEPEIFQEMESLCKGIYESAKYIRFNNSSDK